MKSEPVDPTSTGKRKILIVDDDPNIVSLLSTLLGKDGYEIVHAGYSLPALFRAARHNPDLIITDLQIPVMDGLGLLHQLKGHAETRHIPVLVITGSDTQETRKAAFEAGCAAFLPKPISARDLREQIEQCINK